MTSSKQSADTMETPVGVPRRRRRRRGWLAASLRFVIEFLGTVTLLAIVMGVGFVLYHAARGWLAAHYGFSPE